MPVTTVNGTIDGEELGAVLPHEHLLSLVPAGWAANGGETVRIDFAVQALTRLRSRGFGTVVDLSPYGVVGRDLDGGNVELLQEISRRSGVHVVSGSAIYLESYAPQWALDSTEDDLLRRFVADAEQGIAGTTVRAGTFGEQATSLGEITEFERRVLRAMGRAQRETGLCVMTHTTHGTMALEQIEILEDVGADLSRVVIGHMDTQLETSFALRVLARGVCIAVDTIGKQDWDFFLGPPPGSRPDGAYEKQSFHRSDEGRADLVAELISAGHLGRVLLSQDLTGAEVWMNPDTHGRLLYTYLPDVFLPLLRARGVTDAQIAQMTVSTPRRLLEHS